MNRRSFLITAASPLLMSKRVTQDSFPTANLSNGLIKAKLYLPDAEKGFYRSTRFDWSGVIGSLEYAGHNFYGPWYTKSHPPIWDFEFRGDDIVTGAQSTITGPAEEFSRPQGYDDAAPGETFVKIGVGVLRRGDSESYSPFANYELVDPGTWTHSTQPDAAEFRQEVNDPRSGYGYRYHKTMRLTEGKPELVISHELTNTGSRRMEVSQYSHNFLVLDGATTGPDFLITVPFQIESPQPPDPTLAQIQGNEITFLKMLEDEDRVFCLIEGFSNEVSDFGFKIENKRTGAAVQVTADKPMSRMALWSIRSNISMEPFIDVSTNPGETTSWTLTYRYF